MNTDLIRGALIGQAEKAFHNLIVQVNILLDSTSTYVNRGPAVSVMDKMKHRELASAVEELGTTTKMIGGEVTRWKRAEERVLSRIGVEQNLLNELYANAEPLLWFLIREEVEVTGFSLDLLKSSYSELLRCNRLL